MAYSTANSPYQLVAAPAGGLISTSTSVTAGFANIWAYRDGDYLATVTGSNYVTNAGSLGMKKYDIVFYLNETTTELHLLMANAISSGYATLALVTTSS